MRDEFDKEVAFLNLEGFIEKADYLSETIVERYNLNSGMVKDRKEALMFANNRENMGMEMGILCDYIRNIKDTVSTLREAVGA